MILRDYQRRALDSIYEYYAHNSGNPVLSLPTGSGKTHVIAQLCREAIEAKPDCRIIVLAHVKELLKQNCDKLLATWPQAPAGIFSAGLERREIRQVTIAGIQSVWRRAKQFGPTDIAIVDEAHRIPHGSEGRYRRFLEELEEISPNLAVIGLTATAFRTRSGYLHRGKDALFSDLIFEQDVSELIAQGYLSPLAGKGMVNEIDTTGIAVRAGEFDQKQLEARVANQTLLEAQIAEVLRYGADRKSWLVFASGVDHAETITLDLALNGISAKTVLGKTPPRERDRVIAAFKAGEVRALVSVGVLSEGFDHPGVDMLVLLRPTKSPGLFVQQLGRGLRTADGKKDCLILDFSGNIMRHGPLNMVRVRDPSTGKPQDRVPPQKVCPRCRAIVPAGLRKCDCGHEWPKVGPVLDREATTLEPIATTGRAWVDVRNTHYTLHKKHDRPPSVKVTYSNGLMSWNQFLCPQHGGYSTRKARQFWSQRSSIPMPETAQEWIQRSDQLRTPKRIEIQIVDRWPEILNYEW